MKSTRNYTEFGIYGRPLLWWLLEIPRAILERRIVNYAQKIRRNSPLAWISTSKIWCYACVVEFFLRQLKDKVPDSFYRI